ncbi:MAG: hypothetical protein QOJ16_2515 [Acidobacteriota bacterium]|nr:hypothetical protein [Acidobacteriota bacterium]
MQRESSQRSRLFRWGLSLAILVPALAGAQAPASTSTSTPASKMVSAQPPPACPAPPVDCAGNRCKSNPFKPTDCWTTACGPARADVVVASPPVATSSKNMLYCRKGGYALCFFSGPPGLGATGAKQALPCVYDAAKGVANCTCQYYGSNGYFVDINGILNRGVYFETINTCGVDGSGCWNIADCGQDGSGCSDGSKGLKEPPVCRYVLGQGTGNPSISLYPKGDAISTFSFAMTSNGPFALPPKATSKQCSGPYAGCMTAPCSFGPNGTRTDGSPIQCECPVYNGPYQAMFQPGGQQSCTINSQGSNKKYVWSASNTVSKCP